MDKGKLATIIWDKITAGKEPVLRAESGKYVMDSMPFHAVVDPLDNSLEYICEGKYIKFRPPVHQPALHSLSEDRYGAELKDLLGQGISVELKLSKRHWRKLVRIDSLGALGSLVGNTYNLTFTVDTDFKLPKLDNDYPRIRLGEDSYIEVSQAWDSSEWKEVFEDGNLVDLVDNKIKVNSYFHEQDGQLYFTKEIPVDWLKKAVFPVWTDLDIVWGAAQTFLGGGTFGVYHTKCCEIDTNKFVIVWEDTDSGNAGRCICGTVVLTLITWGAIVDFVADCGAINLALDVCKLDTDKFAVVFPNDIDDDGWARVGEVVVRTITLGPAQLIDVGHVEYPCCCTLDTNKFAMCYNDEGNGDQATVCVCTVDDIPADNTIHPGTPETFGEGLAQYCAACQLDTDKFVFVYIDNQDSDKLKACVFSVVGTNPTAGPIKELDTVDARFLDCEQIDTDKFAVAYEDNDNTRGRAVVCTVDDIPAAKTIHPGTAVTFDDNDVIYIGVAGIDITHFVIVYRDMGDANKGKSNYCSIAGATTITIGAEELLHNATTNFGCICLISANKVAVCYRDDGAADNHGEAVIGDIQIPAPSGIEDKCSNMGAKMIAGKLI